MGGRLTRVGYQELIDGNLAWLEKQPRTLEREHIALVLLASIDLLYSEPVILDTAWHNSPPTVEGVAAHAAAHPAKTLHGCNFGLWMVLGPNVLPAMVLLGVAHDGVVLANIAGEWVECPPLAEGEKHPSDWLWRALTALADPATWPKATP